MKIIKLITFIILILFGIFMIVFGGMDDSPGAQGIGLVSSIVGVIGILKSIRKK